MARRPSVLEGSRGPEVRLASATIRSRQVVGVFGLSCEDCTDRSSAGEMEKKVPSELHSAPATPRCRGGVEPIPIPLGPPLMLSPVALQGTGVVDGISDPFPLTVPSGREETYLARQRAGKPLIHRSMTNSSTNPPRFSTGRRQRTRPEAARPGAQEKSRGPGAGGYIPRRKIPGNESNVMGRAGERVLHNPHAPTLSTGLAFPRPPQPL